MMCEQFDVAVIGAGPAGSATAYWLASHGKRVALVEQSQFDTPRVGESLPPAVQPLLHELGLWTEFLAMQPLPSHGTRSYWGEAMPRVHSHVMNPWGCGWHVDRLAFDLMLANAAVKAGAMPFFGKTFTRCNKTSGGWTIQLRPTDKPRTTARELRSRVFIDAGGRSARLARLAGAQRILLDRLIGVAARFDGIDVGREGYVMVESMVHGWWYSAPLPDNAMMVMAMTDSDLCGKLCFASSSIWTSKLQTAQMTRTRIIDGHTRWGPRVFCAYSHRLRRDNNNNDKWLAVGDAALAVDPISGSGVIRALRSASAGAETALALLEQADQKQDTIKSYEARCDAECTKYLNERAMYYSLEQRWRQHAFWERRNVARDDVLMKW